MHPYIRNRSVWLLATFALLVGLVHPEEAHASETASPVTSILGELERYSLPNGLRVVLNPLPGHASVAVSVTYGVGSRDEEEGRTGLAHLFEHLMSQGSLNVDAGDHARLITARGGNPSASASEESTSYYAEIPTGELELVLWLEADRMFRLALSPKAFETQREVLLQEVRQRSSDPFTRAQLRLHELVFQRYWPYEHPAMGYHQDLERLEYAAVKKFHQNFYVPGRAVVTVAGGFDTAQAKVWINKYFGNSAGPSPLPDEPTPGGRRAPILPRQTSERLSVVEATTAKTPGIYYGWRIPGARTPDNRALELAAFILTGSETSRLREQLVSNEQLAQTVRASTGGFVDADIFRIFVELARRATVDAQQKALERTLTTLAVSGPTAIELERARANLQVRWLQRMEKAKNRALDLGNAEASWGDAALLNQDFSAYDSITPAQVRAAVARYLVGTRRSIVEVYPPGWVRDIGPPIITATYIVKPGDNLTRIAQWHGTTPEAIAKQNGFGLSRRIVVGQRLLITANPSKIVKPITHTIAKGDTLIGIGKKYGVDAADIAKRNGISTKKSIRPGQVLHIPPRAKKDASPKSETKATKGPDAAKPSAGTSTKASASQQQPANTGKSGAPPKATGQTAKSDETSGGKTPPSKPVKTYVVKPGDSLSVIAARHKISVAALTRANGISKKRPIRPGQKLVIPQPD